MANKMSSILILIILISTFGIGMFGFAESFSEDAGTNIPAEYKESIDSLNVSLANSSKLGLKIQTATKSSGGFKATDAGAIVGGALFSIVTLPFEMISIASNVLTTFNQTMGLPAYFVQAILAIIGIFIVFLALSAMLKKDI